MRGWILIPFTIALLSLGAIVGAFVITEARPIECPKDLSTALKGCEIIAITVNNMLFEAQWEASNCNEALMEQMEYNQKLMEMLSPKIRKKMRNVQ